MSVEHSLGLGLAERSLDLVLAEYLLGLGLAELSLSLPVERSLGLLLFITESLKK